MAKGIYMTVDNVLRKVPAAYMTVDSAVRKVPAGYLTVDGVVRQFHPAGTPIGELSVGTSVYANVNGVATEFIVVHQGNPDSTLYSSSCNGTWLLMKNLYEQRIMDSSGILLYGDTSMHTYLNGTFFGLFDASVQNAIAQIKIPYCSSRQSGVIPTVSSGENGLTTKIFIPSCRELGISDSDISADGAKWDYFISGMGTEAKNLRIAYDNDGKSKFWWTRSANKSYFITVSESGWTSNTADTTYIYVRPAMMLNSSATIDKNNFIQG